MMKGYLTVFLAMILSILSGFILFMTSLSIRNSEKIRLECACDISMNSALAEFNKILHDRFGLLYVDLSYLGKTPAVMNLEDRLNFYLKRNLLSNPNTPWGKIDLMNIQVQQIETAAGNDGASMKYQAVHLVEDCGIQSKGEGILKELDAISRLDTQDPLGEWSSLMSEIASIPLPVILNKKGELEEVPLDNPADRVWSMTGSDMLYLLDMDVNSFGVGNIRQEDFISKRMIQNREMRKDKKADDQKFLAYLCSYLGCYQELREDSFLKFQREYIAEGKSSDYENLQAVMERLIKWRFATDLEYAFAHSSLYEEAYQIAMTLKAVQLEPAFADPVAKSIVYACAFLECVSEVKGLASGGMIQDLKSEWLTPIESVLSGETSTIYQSSGLSYEEYLSLAMMLLSDKERNLRAMDLMEMDVRYLSGNSNFQMDWCMESYLVEIKGCGSIFPQVYQLQRRYGYY